MKKFLRFFPEFAARAAPRGRGENLRPASVVAPGTRFPPRTLPTGDKPHASPGGERAGILQQGESAGRAGIARLSAHARDRKRRGKHARFRRGAPVAAGSPEAAFFPGRPQQKRRERKAALGESGARRKRGQPLRRALRRKGEVAPRPARQRAGIVLRARGIRRKAAGKGRLPQAHHGRATESGARFHKEQGGRCPGVRAGAVVPAPDRSGQQR